MFKSASGNYRLSALKIHCNDQKCVYWNVQNCVLPAWCILGFCGSKPLHGQYKYLYVDGTGGTCRGVAPRKPGIWFTAACHHTGISAAVMCAAQVQPSRDSKRDFNAACWDKLWQLHMLLYLSILWSIFFLYNSHISYITVLSPLSSRNLFTSITQLFLAPLFLTVLNRIAVIIAIYKAQ